MDSKTRLTVIVGVVLAAAGWAVAGGDYEETFDQYYQLAAGGRVALENVNGDVSVEVWERDEVRVYAVKSASSPELLDGLKIKVDAGAGGVDIDTEYPSNRHHNSKGGSSMKVEYTLTVPRTARLDDVDLGNGDLSVVGVEGGVAAATVNGNIVVRNCAGDTELGTVNGTIHAAEQVAIVPGGKVFGDIETPSLVIQDGGQFEGRCSMNRKKKAPAPVARLGKQGG